jgi:predicted Fe-Mo cluster-binding NifX family protein
MKILFTSKGENWESPMDPRFGRMDTMIVYDDENGDFQSIPIDTDEMEHGAGLQTAKKALEYRPDIIITGNGAGEKALKLLQKYDIKIYVGAGDMTVKEAYEAFKKGILQVQY